MVGGIGSTHKILIGPAIQVRVLPADIAITSVTSATFTLVHWITEMAEVNTVSRSMTVVGLVLAGILWLAHLRDKKMGLRLE